MATNYRIEISDRSRAKIICGAYDAQDALRKAIGNRLINARHDCSAADGSYAMYDVAVATGPTRHGATPFRNITARIERA